LSQVAAVAAVLSKAVAAALAVFYLELQQRQLVLIQSP
jgi:hypothetical protein